MSGPKKNSEFCFPGPSMFLTEVKGKQNSVFPFCYPSQHKKRNKTAKELFGSRRLAHKFPPVSRIRLDHMQLENSSCFLPRELVSFVCPREFVSFDPQHKTCSAAIRKCIWVGRSNSGSLKILLWQHFLSDFISSQQIANKLLAIFPPRGSWFASY